MAFTADYQVLSDRLDEEVRVALRPAQALLAKIIGGLCSRVPILGKSGKTHRIDRLVEAEAWTECALTLIELELPAWKLRRLVYEGGEWFCTLSRQPHLPPELDDAVDASHEVQSLAIFRAFIEARRRIDADAPGVSAVPRVWLGETSAMCCDNFS
jgi:hypothetical protein